MLRLAETSLPATQLCRLLTVLLLALPFHTELWQDWVSIYRKFRRVQL